ncbi:MAG TPA: glutathione peroxidase [Bacteroidota bacterium]|nr:glutathione peroxidase [Bacteroidota bacterium]
MATPKLYSFIMKTIDGQDRSLSSYEGKVLLIVNVASRCGFTPQYSGLQSLYERFKSRGFALLGFPSNDFGWQEPGSDEEIKKFCDLNFRVTFDLFSKIHVKGSEQHPLYAYLTTETAVPGSVRWNFQKYLVDRRGTVVDRFQSRTEPNDAEVVDKIERLLAETPATTSVG